MEEILEAASRASTVGNMQLYSIIVTTSRELLEQLAPLHFNQPAATTAPVLLTFCADIHRFSRWCELRGAETQQLLAENRLPNLARIFTERRYVREDNVTFSRKYFDELVEQGFFNQQ